MAVSYKYLLPTKSATFSKTKYPVKIATAVPSPGKGLFHRLLRRGCFRQASMYQSHKIKLKKIDGDDDDDDD